MSTFSSFNQSTQEAILNGAALEPPEGQESNFDNPPNGEAGAHAVVLLSILLSTVALVIRLYCRWILARQRSIADYLFIIGWALFLADVVLVYNPSTVPVWFVHLWNIRLKDYITYLRNVFITSELYLFSVAFLKVAILLDWIHIFVPRGTRNVFFWAASITIFVNAGFYIGIIVANQVACTPYEYSWNKLLDGNCDRANTVLATSIAGAFNIASDIVIFLIPQGVIWNLNMSRSRKAGVSVIFTLGLLAIGTAILRFISSLRHAASPDFTYYFTEVALCADAELAFGILVGCVPAFPKVFGSLDLARVKEKLRESTSWLRSQPSSVKSPWSREDYSAAPSLELVPPDRTQHFPRSHHYAMGYSERSTDFKDSVEDGYIYRTTEFHSAENHPPATGRL